MCRLKQRAKGKFQRLAGINRMIDSGEPGAAAAKREMVARDTDGRTARQRQPVVAGSDMWNPEGKRMARGRDDTQWINRKNAGKAGKFAGARQ